MNIMTKVFIVLQLVFSIALAVIVFLQAGAAKQYKDTLDRERVNAVAAQATVTKLDNYAKLLEGQVAEARKNATDRERDLQAKLDRALSDVVAAKAANDSKDVSIAEKEAAGARATASIQSLSKQVETLSAELTAMRPEYTKSIKEREETYRANADLQNRLNLAEKSIRALKEALAQAQEKSTGTAPAAASAGTGSVAQMSDGTTPAVQINGKIEDMKQAQGKTYLTLSLGSRDGVQVGNRFTIYRKNQYIGDAIVRRVTVDQAVAEVTTVKPGQAVQGSDLVISGGGM